MKQQAQEYERWKEKTALDSEMQRWLELAAKTQEELAECFGEMLHFGTGGLRSLMGAGPARMNCYTVAWATQGVADATPPRSAAEKRRVVIAYDSRLHSREFAQTAAAVFAANAFQVYLFAELAPTPLLSYAVRYLHCDVGVCITASHNPAQYNGYKVYGADGCQITLEVARDIQAVLAKTDVFPEEKREAFSAAAAAGKICEVPKEVEHAYLCAVLEQGAESAPTEPLRVVYTPLNGTGRRYVLEMLQSIGINDVSVVPQQEWPDGNFPTCKKPNPELPEALREGLLLCEQVQPDLLLATDPDCDRLGLAVQHKGEYVLLSGNEVGVLLLDYLCRVRTQQGRMPQHPVAVTTIVSTDMAEAVARAYGVELRRTLTGFKFAGEQIGLLETAGDEDRFLFAFEESYGYLAGTYVRDKDGVNAAMLVCQMARAWKAEGKDLAEAMETLYERFGYYACRQKSIVYPGADGRCAMRTMMDHLRKSGLAKIGSFSVQNKVDYSAGVGTLPTSNVLQFELQNGGKVIIRPSGTEPKLKLYFTAVGTNRDAAQETCEKLIRVMCSVLDAV